MECQTHYFSSSKFKSCVLGVANRGYAGNKKNMEIVVMKEMKIATCKRDAGGCVGGCISSGLLPLYIEQW